MVNKMAIASSPKHAFLIIAHQDDYCFRILLSMLDDVRNDIYIHMDLKNKFYDQNAVEKIVHRANIFHIQRTDVSWGAYSQINAEILLLRAALAQKQSYAFYHLLSGQDLPINTQDYIHNFFDSHIGMNFVQFEDGIFEDKYSDRVHCYHPFQQTLGRESDRRLPGKHPFKWLVSRSVRFAQKYCCRVNDKIDFQKGSNWWSISDSLARFVVLNSKWIEKHFKSALCCDEVFLQTLIYNSSFIDHLFRREFDDSNESIYRLIDWRRGSPYVFRLSDWMEISQSKLVFARKFDPEVDSSIIKKIFESYS